MNQTTVTHGTVVVERNYPASPSHVFAAYENVASRSAWGVASLDDTIVYDEADFRAGGTDRYRCGPGASLNYRGTIDYYDIVADTRIVYVETVSETSLLSISLVTYELFPAGTGTRLVVTDRSRRMSVPP